jgi:hypothetical protein
LVAANDSCYLSYYYLQQSKTSVDIQSQSSLSNPILQIATIKA